MFCVDGCTHWLAGVLARWRPSPVPSPLPNRSSTARTSAGLRSGLTRATAQLEQSTYPPIYQSPHPASNCAAATPPHPIRPQPFFFNPRPEAVIQPLPAFVTPERPPVYNPIPWAHFRDLRYAGGGARHAEGMSMACQHAAGIALPGSLMLPPLLPGCRLCLRPGAAAVDPLIGCLFLPHALPCAGDYADTGEEVQVWWAT